MNDDLGRVRVELETARRSGVPFDPAWRSALSSLPAVDGRGDPVGDRALTAWALETTKSEWRSAYEGRPTIAWVAAAGRMALATEPHSEAHPMALLVEFLVAFGCACGRGAHYEVEADRHYPNHQFCVLVGPSSKARICCAQHMRPYGAPQPMLR